MSIPFTHCDVILNIEECWVLGRLLCALLCIFFVMSGVCMEAIGGFSRVWFVTGRRFNSLRCIRPYRISQAVGMYKDRWRSGLSEVAKCCNACNRLHSQINEYEDLWSKSAWAFLLYASSYSTDSWIYPCLYAALDWRSKWLHATGMYSFTLRFQRIYSAHRVWITSWCTH